MSADRPRRVEVRIDGRIHYSQDVARYSLEHTPEGELTLTASRAPAKAEPLKVPDNPLLPPAPTPGAPDGHDETPAGPPVIETVHTGARDLAAEEAATKARRDASRKAAQRAAADTAAEGEG